jgi:ABC-type bacteriocin/lantibiotic exporter with double-glycine peptidase domain
MPNFTHYRQLDAMDCGPTCLRMVAKHHGKTYTLQTLREKSEIGKAGVSLLASNNLILVLNPTCASCRVSYLTAKRLLEMNMDIKVQIVLATSLAIEDEAGRIARIILSQVSDNDIKNTIDEWFKDSTKNINKWLKRIETKAENNDGRQQIEMHVRWLELTGISEAPVKFLNNHEIPKVYLADDLLKLIKNYSKLGFANQQ